MLIVNELVKLSQAGIPFIFYFSVISDVWVIFYSPIRSLARFIKMHV